MSNYRIDFYVTSDGSCPIRTFLDQLNTRFRVKAIQSIEILEEYGHQLREPHSKHIESGIFELRIQFSGDIVRIFYFFYVEKRIILTNGYIKKTRKAPRKHIEMALRYKTDYERRFPHE